MAVYPGNPAIYFDRAASATDTVSALTKITLGSHTGTHIDAPAHIDPRGPGTAAYSLEAMVGPATVLDLSSVPDVISASDVPPFAAARVVIKTNNSAGDINTFNPDFVALSEEAARVLVERGVSLVGIDALSVKKKGVRDKVHKILLDAGIVILEGLWLHGIEAGEYELLCLPLALRDMDGAPARAILRSLDK